jgi:hypothetical protein
MEYNEDLLGEAKQAAQEVLGKAGLSDLGKLANALVRLCQAIENVEIIDPKREPMHDQEAAMNRVKKAATDKLKKQLKSKKKKR